MKKTAFDARHLTLAAMLIAIAQVLPFFLGNVQVLAQGVSPMHIPALIAGLVLGPWWGLALGVVMPLLRGLLFQLPPLFPTATCMAFELAAYGLLTGLLYPRLARRFGRNHLPAIIAAMLVAMVVGRCVGGLAQALISLGRGASYGVQAFLTAYFAKTAVGAVLHLIVVPAIVLALERAKLSPLAKELA